MGFSDTFIVDIGTSHTRIAKVGCGLLMREPTVAAVSKNGDNKVLAAGKNAVLLYNRFPDGVIMKSPFKGDKITDGSLLCETVKKLFEGSNERFKRGASRRVLLPVRYGVDNLCKKQIMNAMQFAMSGSVTCISSIFCSAYGSLAYEKSQTGGTLIMDMGVKRTSVAIICFGKVCTEAEVTWGAGDINAFLLRNENKFTRERALEIALKPIINMLEELFIATSPELVGDIIRNGIYITGGGGKIMLLKNVLSKTLNVGVYTDEAGSDAVVFGALKMNGNEIKSNIQKERAISI